MRPQDYITITLFRLAAALGPRIPPGIGYGLAAWAGEVNYRLSKRVAGAVRDNVRHVLGDTASAVEIDQVARRIFRNLIKNYYDLFRLAAADTPHVLSLLDVAGEEHIQAAQALGRGMIAASAHYGNPELLMQAVAALRVPILAVAEHLKPERFYQHTVELRSRHGLRLIPADGRLVEVYRTVRRGEAVALALDRDTTGSGVQVHFLGAPARLPDGYARLVARTRAPLVIGFARRLPGERLRLDMEPPYVPPEEASREEVYAQALDFGVQALARAVTAHPDQWVLTTAIWNVECGQ
jgi:KDO2-lipid IV(A) lauroyltransferase